MSQRASLFWYGFSPVFFLGTTLGIICLLSLQNIYSFFAVPLILSLHHGCHETVHGVLVPKTWPRHKQLNFILGCLGYAVVGHNYLLLRWSHSYHHLCGRLHASCTIDMTESHQGLAGKIQYYLSLCGWGAVFHEIAGYIFPILPKTSAWLGHWFRRGNYRNKRFLCCQLFTFLTTVFLFYIGGYYFLFCRLLFLPLWGIGQNVSHYALPVGSEALTEFASRTYRVNPVVNFLFYGYTFYHYEHHVLPKVPGLLLGSSSVKERIKLKVGFNASPKFGLVSYLKDALRQFCGPYPKVDENWSTQILEN
ncbi:MULTISPECIES: fatty acid desaturase [Trichocoleus]|uniref:Fatty acid desaturase n=1 Tax=Trichocoleus desertorum GB2-A4 TaxID=2933944 RepID=A0ABV0JIE2_9CYAN|nr:fatty acid desaturase [Trichocoleus sp. FACHB-46]MBD1862323.1 fatty acid desaturase [Trichocoleus sp. FACHB-46]